MWNLIEISTHALTWSATLAGRHNPPRAIFQLTRSRGARRDGSGDWLGNWIYFNSRAHVERDFKDYRKNLIAYISTHALTWSATRQKLQSQSNIQFQLTRSRGARLVTCEDLQSAAKISTHALTWSATPVRRLYNCTRVLFQLTRSRGARPRGTWVSISSS